MAFVVKNGLQNFANKLKNYKAQGDLAERVVEKVANKGIEIAQNKWGNQANVIQRGDGVKRSIIAVDNNKINPSIAYTEFGTGIQGEGKYEGKLPTQNISFTDKNGLEWTAQGWEYYYPNSKTKRTVGGQEGWFHNRQFVTGQPAQAQMWRTANELEQGEAKQAVEQLFKERDI